MEINKRDKRAIWLGGTGVCVILAYFVALEPIIATYNQMIENHGRLSAKLARIYRDNKAEPVMKKYILESEEIVGPLSAPELYSRQITTVSNNIMTAGQCGVQIKNTNWITPRAWPDDPKLEMAMVQIDCEGMWENICKFIAALYRTEGVFSIEQMDMTGDKKRGGMITMKLTVSVLVRAEAENAGVWAK